MHITPRREARPTTCTWFLPYLGGGTEPARADWKLPGLDRAYSGDLTGGDQPATQGPDDSQARTTAVSATMRGDMGASGNDRMGSSGLEDQEGVDGERPAA